MTNFSLEDANCRVDIFRRETEEWYTTIVVKFTKYYSVSLLRAFKIALFNSIPNMYIGMRVVCLKPYHEHAHPISIIWDGSSKEAYDTTN